MMDGGGTLAEIGPCSLLLRLPEMEGPGSAQEASHSIALHPMRK